ncbi:MAG: TlyA family RNA methyltransferase [Mahellales bacterium]|jgi:23S rRNA (cytidine1920-2'-O)/16S rRNA (cytidine1409-2'-O)-methyltransferase
MQNNNIRLDVELVNRKLYASRTSAQRAIMAGLVRVNNTVVDKPGTFIKPEDIIEIKKEAIVYVSRGGVKLDKALKTFDISVEGLLCMDVGASTGGFTDCLLRNGARKVYAIDVGYGQLAWKLRNDPKVIVMERTNIRYIRKEQIPDIINFCVIDVSFISLKLVLPVVKEFLDSDGKIVCLVKPQFEAGKDKVGKNGVVRERDVHRDVLSTIIDYCTGIELPAQDLTYSPITGPKGNIEFLLLLSNNKNNPTMVKYDKIETIVNESHLHLL